MTAATIKQIDAATSHRDRENPLESNMTNVGKTKAKIAKSSNTPSEKGIANVSGKECVDTICASIPSTSEHQRSRR